MQLTDEAKKKYIQKIYLSRFRILNDNPFYGLLLMHVKFGLDEDCKTAYTDGDNICFSPDFLSELSNKEVDFVLMHEILHIALKHCERGNDYDPFLFNIACDIVVNSNILKSNDMDISSITVHDVGALMHQAPNGVEGYNYTAEEVYQMLIKKKGKNKTIPIDDHTHWKNDNGKESKWDEIVSSAINSLKMSNRYGTIPSGVERQYNELTNPKLDWKTILNDFISYEVNDYSFAPPDRRYNDFFLPDFNESEEIINKTILFAIDTSGSMTKEDITGALSEIKGALSYKPLLSAYAVCFDATIYEPESIDDFNLSKLRILGGGGTSYKCLFDNLDKIKSKINNDIDFIIIISDGVCEFPKEEVRQNIPVLWIINNTDITPPWGAIARI